MTTAVKFPAMMTVADFLDWPGDGTETRYERVDGVLRAMAAASGTHNTTDMTFCALLFNHLRKNHPHCRVAGPPGIEPHVRAKWNFRQPGLVITCTPNRQSAQMTPHPIEVIEVLSASNTADTYENVKAYTTIPSVRDIFVVHSTEIRVDHLVPNTEGNWPADPEFIVSGGIVPMTSFDVAWPIGAIYANTHLI